MSVIRAMSVAELAGWQAFLAAEAAAVAKREA